MSCLSAAPDWLKQPKDAIGPESDRLLLVETGPSLAPLIQQFPGGVSMIYCRFTTISPEFVRRVAPDCILSPIVARQFDIVDLVRLLDRCNYRGSVVAVTDPLPAPTMVLTELRRFNRRLDMSLLELASAGGRRLHT